MGIFVYASTATGKSNLSKKYRNVVDMETTIYKYIDGVSDKSKKSTSNRILNPDYPNNYFNALEKAKDRYDYILIADEICDKFLFENNCDYIRVFPALELKDEYLKRCRDRGNNEAFINYYNQNWNDWYNSSKNDKNAKELIELQSGQYLEDVLKGLIPYTKLNEYEDDIFKIYYADGLNDFLNTSLEIVNKKKCGI